MKRRKIFLHSFNLPRMWWLKKYIRSGMPVFNKPSNVTLYYSKKNTILWHILTNYTDWRLFASGDERFEEWKMQIIRVTGYSFQSLHSMLYYCYAKQRADEKMGEKNFRCSTKPQWQRFRCAVVGLHWVMRLAYTNNSTTQKSTKVTTGIISGGTTHNAGE